MTKKTEQLTDLRALILCEIGDFFAGFGNPGEPETPEDMQRELTMRVGRILNDHIVNYPRCEALVEILSECRIARDEAQAELHERRKADCAEPVAWLHTDNGIGIPAITRNRNVANSWLSKGWKIQPLYTVATQSTPIVKGGDDAL